MSTPSLPIRAREKRLAERARSGRLIRDSICLLSSKWAVDVLLALGDGTRRYHELLEDLSPISEKVLTQTLRAGRVWAGAEGRVGARCVGNGGLVGGGEGAVPLRGVGCSRIPRTSVSSRGDGAPRVAPSLPHPAAVDVRQRNR